MENETDFLGTPLDLMAEKERIEKERQAVSRFVKLQDGELVTLHFTSKVYRGTNSYGNDAIYFELEELNDKGEHKLFSVGAKNSVVSKIISQLLEGNKAITIMRAGTGTNTQYTIVKNRV